MKYHSGSGDPIHLWERMAARGLDPNPYAARISGNGGVEVRSAATPAELAAQVDEAVKGGQSSSFMAYDLNGHSPELQQLVLELRKKN